MSMTNTCSILYDQLENIILLSHSNLHHSVAWTMADRDGCDTTTAQQRRDA